MTTSSSDSVNANIHPATIEGTINGSVTADGFAYRPERSADAIIVNTCAVTAEAVRQSRQAIRKLRRENGRQRAHRFSLLASVLQLDCEDTHATSRRHQRNNHGAAGRIAPVDDARLGRPKCRRSRVVCIASHLG